MRAIWNDTVIAESNDTIIVENNHYFPADSVNMEFFSESSTHTMCPWKGEANYYNVNVNGSENQDAAWYYPKTKALAKHIEGYVAFWKGVEVKK